MNKKTHIARIKKRSLTAAIGSSSLIYNYKADLGQKNKILKILKNQIKKVSIEQ